MKNPEVLAFSFIPMQSEMKTFQCVSKARQSKKETDRQTSGAT